MQAKRRVFTVRYKLPLIPQRPETMIAFMQVFIHGRLPPSWDGMGCDYDMCGSTGIKKDEQDVKYDVSRQEAALAHRLSSHHQLHTEPGVLSPVSTP